MTGWNKDGKACASVYTGDGEYKFSLDTNRELIPTTQSEPTSITVSTDGIYYVIDRSPFVKTYNPAGVFKSQWETVPPVTSSSGTKKGRVELGGLTKDSKGHLLVGQVWSPMYISKHSQDGAHIASISVDIRPYFLATTSNDTLVVSAPGDDVV